MDAKLREKAYIDSILEASKAAAGGGTTPSVEVATRLVRATEKERRNGSATTDDESGNIINDEDGEPCAVVKVNGSDAAGVKGAAKNEKEEIYKHGRPEGGDGDDAPPFHSTNQRAVVIPRRYFPLDNSGGGDSGGSDGGGDGDGDDSSPGGGRGTASGEGGGGNTLVNATLVSEDPETATVTPITTHTSIPPSDPPPLLQEQPPLVPAMAAPKGVDDHDGGPYDGDANARRKCLLRAFIILCFVMLVALGLTIGLLWQGGRNGIDDDSIPEDVPPEQGGEKEGDDDDDDGNPNNATHGIGIARHYWDCSGGACGCSHLPYDDPDEPAYCHGNIMVRAPEGNPHNASFYGTAAISQFLGGDWWLGDACTRCWKVTGTSNAGPTAGTRTTLIIKGTNFCPPSECDDDPVFVIAAPGFLGTGNSPYSACEERELIEDLESWTTCVDWDKDNLDKCDCTVFKDPVLVEGCENFRTLGWDEPTVQYEALDECPMELGELPCWEANGNNYPEENPELCAVPFHQAAGT